jgi:hypothetical protein
MRDRPKYRVESAATVELAGLRGPRNRTLPDPLGFEVASPLPSDSDQRPPCAPDRGAVDPALGAGASGTSGSGVLGSSRASGELVG